jgi:SGNH hydrolase-like domain, acetyltransferase AlgX
VGVGYPLGRRPVLLSKAIPVINMIPDFQAHEPRDYPLYFRNDGHWLPAGHAIAAASIFKQLLPFLKRAESGAQT